MKFTKLSSLLRQQFGGHKSRIECLLIFVTSLIQARTVNLSLLSQRMDYDNADSAYKRLQRFIREFFFTPGRLAYLTISIIGFDKRGQWQLIFDRTNWKFGKKHINILFLCVCGKNVSIPLFFTFLKGKKSGNSNQQDRIDLIQKFIRTFGKKRIGVILGDREFVGWKWLGFLVQEQIPFCIRLKEGWQMASSIDGRMIEIKKHFKGLKTGKSKSLGLRKLGVGKQSIMCHITGLKNKKGDWVIVAHSEKIENPCKTYRDRWQIESMFRAMKTSGFQLEDTHVTRSERLECLIGILCIAFAICYKSGEIAIKENPPKPKKHGYWPKSIFRYGLDKITQAFAQIWAYPAKIKTLFAQIFAPVRLSKSCFVL